MINTNTPNSNTRNKDVRYTNTDGHFYRLELTKMHELNVPRDPCNPSPKYNFLECIKDFVTTKVLQSKAFP